MGTQTCSGALGGWRARQGGVSLMDHQVIVEVYGPASQGRSEAFHCRANDGHDYYVKGANSGRSSQIAEWICAHLGRRFGLPIPEATLLEMDAQLIDLSAQAKRIGEGLVFGSRKVQAASWFEPGWSSKVPDKLQQDILVFDCWVQNLDRTDSNPNLLLQLPGNTLHVIDHNLAFDLGFDVGLFAEEHIFRVQWDVICLDLVARADYHSRLAEALAGWDEACATLPDEWRWHDQEETVPADFDFARAFDVLTRCNDDIFRGVNK